MTAPLPLALLIEDEPPMRSFLRASLESQGLRLQEAETAREGLALARSRNPENVLLDLGLLDGDGIELTKQLREWSRVPIIVISARDREDDKVAALDAGADDYVTKPFGVNELLARIRVALRHVQPSHTPQETVIEIGVLRIDMARRLVSVEGREVHLTPIEYRLIAELARHQGKVLTHRQLLHELACLWNEHPTNGLGRNVPARSSSRICWNVSTPDCKVIRRLRGSVTSPHSFSNT